MLIINIIIRASLYERSANGIKFSLVPSVCPHMWAVATWLIGSGCCFGWWVGSARYGCINFWWWSSKGKGQFGGEYYAEMAYWSMIDSCVKSWQYFPTQILNYVSNSLSYDVVRFKIEVGVEEKFVCKNVTKQIQHGDRAVAAELWPVSHFCSGTAYNSHTPGCRVEPNLSTRLDSLLLWYCPLCRHKRELLAIGNRI